MSNDDCNERLASYQIIITDQMLCASDGGNLKERDACQVRRITVTKDENERIICRNELHISIVVLYYRVTPVVPLLCKVPMAVTRLSVWSRGVSAVL